MGNIKKRHEVVEHSFNIQLAKELHSVEKAVLLKNFDFWLTQNQSNKLNYRKESYWTYNTSEAYAEMFPYMKPSSIRRWLIELERDGWLISNSFNKFKIDKTKWYTYGPRFKAFIEVKTTETLKIYDAQNEHRGLYNERQIAQTEQSMFAQNEQAIPDTTLNTNTVWLSKHIKKQLGKHFKKQDGLEDFVSVLMQVTPEDDAIKVFNSSLTELTNDEKYKFKYNVGVLEEIVKRRVQEHNRLESKPITSSIDNSTEVTITIENVKRNIEQHRAKFNADDITQIEKLIMEGKHISAQNYVIGIIGDEYTTAA